MKSLVPSQIQILQDLIYHLESGNSLRDSVITILAQDRNEDPFVQKMKIWIKQNEAGLSISDFLIVLKSASDRQIFALLERGIRGEPVLKYLIQLEQELQEQIRIARDRSLAMLPLYLLLPLLLMIFPAYLIVLLVPLLSEFGALLK